MHDRLWHAPRFALELGRYSINGNRDLLIEVPSGVDDSSEEALSRSATTRRAPSSRRAVLLLESLASSVRSRTRAQSWAISRSVAPSGAGFSKIRQHCSARICAYRFAGCGGILRCSCMLAGEPDGGHASSNSRMASSARARHERQ